MKKVLSIAGAVIGVFFAIWDTLVNSADTAVPDQEFRFSIHSRPFFIVKTLTYLFIGAVWGGLIGLLLDKAGKKK